MIRKYVFLLSHGIHSFWPGQVNVRSYGYSVPLWQSQYLRIWLKKKRLLLSIQNGPFPSSLLESWFSFLVFTTWGSPTMPTRVFVVTPMTTSQILATELKMAADWWGSLRLLLPVYLQFLKVKQNNHKIVQRFRFK